MSKSMVAKICIFIMTVLLVSACGNDTRSGRDKIAFVNWSEAVSGHPKEPALRRNEKIVEDLIQKRDAQVAQAEAQLNSVLKLNDLRQRSRQSFLEADFSARMAEAQAEENKNLEKQFEILEQEAEAIIAERRRSVEDEYRLEIFNLRLQLEAVKMNPEERTAVEQRLYAAQAERSRKLEALFAEKKAYLGEKIQPYVLVMHQRLDDRAKQLNSDAQAKLSAAEGKYEELLGTAPQALNRALEIMDKEIRAQQEKNEQLRKKIDTDIESVVVRLAQERGYTVVFSECKVNVRADDLTKEIIKEIKNLEK